MFYGKGSDHHCSCCARWWLWVKPSLKRRSALKELFTFVKKTSRYPQCDEWSSCNLSGCSTCHCKWVCAPRSGKNCTSWAKNWAISTWASSKEGSWPLHEKQPDAWWRLGISHPEITRNGGKGYPRSYRRADQSRQKAMPEIMIPLPCSANELEHQKAIVERIYVVCTKMKVRKYLTCNGTMIEIQWRPFKANHRHGQ